MKSGIYKLYWNNCDYFYYGQSVYIAYRYKEHLKCLRGGYHHNEILQRCFNKYGNPYIKIVEYCEISMLDYSEQKYLDLYHSDKYCCNIDPIASSSRGRKMKDKHKKRLSILKTGTKLSPEHKALISEGLKNAYKNGRKTHLINKEGASNYFFGKNHTEKTKLKMKGAGKRLGATNGRARLVLNVETGIYYDFVGEAALSGNIIPSKLRAVLCGKDRVNKTSFVYA